MAAFLSEHGVAARPGDGWQAVECPWHDDSTASASFNEGEGVFRCHGCDVKGTIEHILTQVDGLPAAEVARKMEALPTSSVTPAPTRAGRVVTGPALALIRAAAARYHEDVHLAKDYLADRGFSRDIAEAQMFGVVDRPAPGHDAYLGRLAIPYITTSGVVDIRFRCLKDHDCKQHKCPKYLSLPGSVSRMYDARRVMDGGAEVAVCEGELDAVAMTHLVGIPAVGIPGANNWHQHYCHVLSGFDRVWVVGDGDEAGRKFCRSVAALADNSVEVVMPDGHDVNSLTITQGPASVRELCYLLQ